jgi:tetratricopeptide (TPR) repeat protein
MLKARDLYVEQGTGYYAALASFYENLGYAYYWTDRELAQQQFQLALDTIVAHEAEELQNAYYFKYFGRLADLLDRPADYRRGVLTAIEMDPNDPYVLVDRGVYYRTMGNEYLAEQDIRAALNSFRELPPPAAYFWQELAWTLSARGDLAGALKAWDANIALLPEALASYVSRGGIRLKLGDQSGAEDDFRMALAEVGEDPDLLNQIAIALDNAGYYERALTFYERAYTARPGPLFRHNIAVTYWNLGDYMSAQRELDRALLEKPGNADWLNFGGDLASQSSDNARPRAVPPGGRPAPVALAPGRAGPANDHQRRCGGRG